MPPIKKISKLMIIQPTIATTAYAANQVIGGLQKLTDFYESFSGVTEIVDAEVFDNANQKSLLSIIIFGGKPAGTYADGTAFSPSQADLNLIDAVLTMPVANYTSFATNAVCESSNIRNKCQASKTSNQNLNNSDGKNAYMVVVSGGTPTYGATNALAIQLGIEQDV